MNYLGMMDGTIDDSQISASSSYNSDSSGVCYHTHARLHKTGGTFAWCASSASDSQWIEVDLLKMTHFTGLIIQGRYNSDQFVTSFKVRSSMDGSEWLSIKTDSWDGMVNITTTKKHLFLNSLISYAL